MCKGIEDLRKEEREEGLKKGVAKGADRVNTLHRLLIDQGRMNDLRRAVQDREFQEILMKELLPEELYDTAGLQA